MFQPEYEQRLLQQMAGARSSSGNTGKQQLDLRCIPQRTGSQAARNFELPNDLKPDHVELQGEKGKVVCHSSPYACLLRNEYLGTKIASLDQCKVNAKIHADTGDFKVTENTRLYRYGNGIERNDCEASVPALRMPFATVSEPSQRLLSCSAESPTRRLSRVPYKILDAPELLDDFYLNLIDWSSENILAVGLGYSVYLWNAVDGQVTRLCDFSQEDNLITAVSWRNGGGDAHEVAIGTQSGHVSIWDAGRQKQLNRFEGHTARVNALAWRGNNLSSGSHDWSILQRDVRTPPLHITRCLRGHKNGVCGLQWSPSHKYLASGGNDNRLLVWTDNSPEPIYAFEEHKAVVKALAWSPHKSGLLASGGGTADGFLRFWNVLTGKMVQYIDTGAQISNLAWSRNSSELVTTHGYSQPQVIVWRYPSLKQVVRLSGHTHRVIYLAVSPDNESLVTGGGDETLRFWTAFTKRQPAKVPNSVLSLNQIIR
ncbi:hypothetical protein KR038_010150 [Drosophila bunnanda]|nr:hypothetical protein KR038_010150 [Drosophila bunnanda]